MEEIKQKIVKKTSIYFLFLFKFDNFYSFRRKLSDMECLLDYDISN